MHSVHCRVDSVRRVGCTWVPVAQGCKTKPLYHIPLPFVTGQEWTAARRTPPLPPDTHEVLNGLGHSGAILHSMMRRWQAGLGCAGHDQSHG